MLIYDWENGNLVLRYERNGKVTKWFATQQLVDDIKCIHGLEVEEELNKLLEEEWKYEHPFG